MKKLNEAEGNLLKAVRKLTLPNKMFALEDKLANRETLLEFGKVDAANEDELDDWAQALANLITRGLLQEVDGIYSLTDEGSKYAYKVQYETFSKGFDKSLITVLESPTYGVLCERVYGKNLLQFNMVDMEQLGKLLEILNLNDETTVLDLGCGAGMISEYISDSTGAKVTGLDFTPGAIKMARERTKNKRDRLNFIVGDLNDLDLTVNSFDTVIAIDTLYFVDDIESTITRVKAALKSGGQMGIFFSEIIGQDNPEELLLPGKNRLGRVLNELGARYETWDFTELESVHWNKLKTVLNELKPRFEDEGEGILELLKDLLNEANEMLGYVNSQRTNRYLYRVRI